MYYIREGPLKWSILFMRNSKTCGNIQSPNHVTDDRQALDRDNTRRVYYYLLTRRDPLATQMSK